jgi:NifU-like protein involved in Fe-S cluster formation
VQEEKTAPLSDEKPQSTGGAIAQLSQELAVEAVTGKSSDESQNTTSNTNLTSFSTRQLLLPSRQRLPQRPSNNAPRPHRPRA